MVQETSIQAYKETAELRREQKEVVREYFRKHPNSCDGECWRDTGIPRALVAARRADLKMIDEHPDGKIFSCGHKVSPVSGKRVLTWGAV